MSANPDRLGLLTDVTRWNRAGLSRFQYVDGDAASWLEELRIAAVGLVARGAPLDERLPETWRGRFSQDPAQWPDQAERDAFVETLAWHALARAWPDRPETAGRRNARLVEQYRRAPDGYGWEIMRAAARMAHVLLGHLDAYANEGYLRTATQWRNIARLAAMVNHRPAPPTSAITTVGLIVEPVADDAAIELPRGLAMKYTPAEGGAPVVFETLERVTAHAALNAGRGLGWNRDPTPLAAADSWVDDPKAELAPGTLAVLETTGGTGAIDAVVIAGVARDPAAGTAALTLARLDGSWPRGTATLRIEPRAVRRGLPRTIAGLLVVKLATAANYPIDSIVRLHWPSGSKEFGVAGNADGHLKLTGSGLPVHLAHGAAVSVETLAPVAGSGGDLIVSSRLTERFFFHNASNTIVSTMGDAVPAVSGSGATVGKLGINLGGTVGAVGLFWTPTPGARRESATVVRDHPPVVPGTAAPQPVVVFAGKPPKGLAIGDVMVRRALDEGAIQPLRVLGVALADDSYAIQFDAPPPGLAPFQPDLHEFHGPMTRALRPRDGDRHPGPAFAGNVIRLQSLPEPAREQVRLGRRVLVEDERGLVPAVLGVVAEAERDGDALRLTLEPGEGLGGFVRGWTTLNLNAVPAGHGETRSPKTLGSGDGERALQSFALNVREVSFMPSSVAESGVAPDIDVTVNGLLWTYRDLADPTADGTESWSSALAEDGGLVIHFRRRLPTGTDNVVARRYRTGVGPGGTVPAGAFTRPVKKHRWVRALTQPLAATGGADRESVGDIRVNAPARLAANGRAVSLTDFARLCRRRSDVWQALAYPLNDPARSEQVAIILVPANGGEIGPTLAAELTAFVEARSVPGVRVALEPYEPVRLLVEASVRVDGEAFDRSVVQASAQAALLDAFSLRRRALGQPAYIAEVVAALERVNGVETAIVKSFAVPDESALLRVARTDDANSAFFPHPRQVVAAVAATATADMTVKVEAL